jgi:hypothetical protein
MCKIAYKFEKNESYQFFKNICKPNLACFTSILQKIGSIWLQKYLPYWTILIKSYKYEKGESYKYV